jgi:hypothetical protein
VGEVHSLSASTPHFASLTSSFAPGGHKLPSPFTRGVVDPRTGVWPRSEVVVIGRTSPQNNGEQQATREARDCACRRRAVSSPRPKRGQAGVRVELGYCLASLRRARASSFTACSSTRRLASLRGSEARSRCTNSCTTVNSMSSSISENGSL